VPSLSKILLPVDFSERSAGAARYAKLLAGHFRSEITLLHSLTPLHHEFGAIEIAGTMLVDVYRIRADQATKELDAFMAQELAGLNVRRVLVNGDPAEKIVQFAHEEHVDLITMPTHGYGPFRRFILGSNTAKVLHDADCPVWTGVHLEEARPAASMTIRSILCALDLGPQSGRTLAWADWLRQEFNARLTVIHATALGPEAADDAQRQWGSKVHDAAEAELQLIQRDVGAEADLLLEAGEPAHVICSAAARFEADVLVIGRGSAAGVFGRLRTNAYAIIRQSPCPVVSV
jgi:nucleotide-binding universal stress UspA family protein